MTANHIADRHNLTKLASHVDGILTDMTEKVAEKISSLNNEIKRIDRLLPTSEAEERENALSATQTKLDATEQQLRQVKKDAGWGGLLAPFQTLSRYKDVRRAKAEHARATEKFESQEERETRTSRVSEHNQNVVRERDRLPGLEQDLGESERESTDLTNFRQQVAEAITAARADGWIAPNFPEKFQAMAQHLEAGKLAEATGCLSELKFQCAPSTQTYESWCQEATQILEKAYADYSGFAAAGAYTEIAGRSIDLALPTLRADSDSFTRLTNATHTADQWQMLAAILTDPRSLRTDVLWAVYWSMFQCSQWLAKALAQAEVNEDLFTGKVTAELDRWLSDWGTGRIQQFGYPAARSYMGTFEIAGKDEETRLGADLGMVVDIDIGGLVCRKVALFQAKKVVNGRADIGSTSAQLAELSARPQTAFYLFYHQATHPLRSPAPTVCSAAALAECVTNAGRGLDDGYLPVNVRALGWDWTSFLSFGLCNADTDLGESFSNAEEAVALLGEGDPRHLPKYLYVIAIADEPRVMELRAKIQEHYLESLKTMEKTRHMDKSREIDDKDHGMHL